MKKVLILIVLFVVLAIAYKERPKTEDVKLDAWAVFETYLEYAKTYDLEAIKILSYQLSDDCKMEPITDKCKDRIATAYHFGGQFKLEDIKHIAFDKNQIILATDYTKTIDQNSSSIIRGILYFVKEGDEIKFLSMNPFQGVIGLRLDSATSTADARLDALVEDKDQDFLADKDEMCDEYNASADCIKSDPKKRDTNGNGFWDSVDRLFYKSSTQ